MAMNSDKLRDRRPPPSERQWLLNQAGTDDYTLTDAYNREFGTSLKCPLPLKILREFVTSR